MALLITADAVSKIFMDTKLQSAVIQLIELVVVHNKDPSRPARCKCATRLVNSGCEDSCEDL
eukprot:2875871-Pleurochrysis_carterae.AAC.1